MCRRRPHYPRHRQVWPVAGAAVANCPCEDGPRLQPLPIAKSRGERNRTFPCKHAPVQFAFDGFDILYRLWTLPYNFLTRIICATVSVIVRRRRSSSTRVDHHTTRSAVHERFLHTAKAVFAHLTHIIARILANNLVLNNARLSSSL